MAAAERCYTRAVVLTILQGLLLAAATAASSLQAAARQPPVTPDAAAQRRGSETARAGFRNEDQIRDAFRNWKTDRDAQKWLRAMNYRLPEIDSVHADKPHGVKADVEVQISLRSGQRQREGISIKLVSGRRGFNQVDKRWLKAYAAMWQMPPQVVDALKLYLGETAPTTDGRRPDRMYLNELPEDSRQSVVEFFQKNKRRIVQDLFTGPEPASAKWFMVTQQTENSARWTIRPLNDVIDFYAEGDVVLTRSGNLRIGRVSMQRKGGDNGRETARMLQFKIDPVLVLDEL